MSKRNKNRKFYQVPSNQEVNNITKDERYSHDVAKGLISLHKVDTLIKEYVISVIDQVYDRWILTGSTVTKVEIIAPHLVPVNADEFDGNYVTETIKAFIDSPSMSEDIGNIDAFTEAFLIQVELKDLNNSSVEPCYVRGGVLMVDDAEPTTFLFII